MLSVLECDREISATSFYDFYAGILYRGTKSKDRDHDENGKRFNSRVDVRRKILPYIWIAGMILCLLFHAIQYRIWKKRIFAECKKMQKISVLDALKKASEVCKIKKQKSGSVKIKIFILLCCLVYEIQRY